MPSWKKLIVSGSDAAIPSISQANGDFTLDVSGDINLDAGGADINLKDDGTHFGSIKRVTSDLVIKAETSNKHMLLKGNDGGSTITALDLDMENAGNALFNGNISGSQIEASGDVIAFSSSDRELKDNITYIHRPIDKINRIGGYKFTWNNNQDTYLGKDVGVIAQEIEAVLPEIVTTRATGYKAVKYEKIVPLLIEGIKELDKKIKDIEKNCDCLKK